MDRIPAEVWIETLVYLEPPDLKNVRLINRYLKTTATSLCFATISFDLRKNLDHIIELASSELAICVQTLAIRPKPLLRYFDFDTWERAVSLPGDPRELADVIDCDEDCLMSHKDWSDLSENERKAAYEKYEADRAKEADDLRKFTDDLYFRKLGCIQKEAVHPKRMPETGNKVPQLGQLDEALRKFSNLTTIKHEPGFIFNYASSSLWRHLRFELGDLVCNTSYAEDEDWEAFQVSIILRALGWADCKLNSMTLYVGGPAFWGPDRLRRLWQGNGHGDLRILRKDYSNAAEADLEAHLRDEISYSVRDQFLRQLTMMEYALTNLTHLDWSISDEEEDGSLFSIVGPCFEFLRGCEKLEQTRLNFGRLVEGELPYLNDETRDNGDGPGELLAELAKQTPWPKLRILKLEIIIDENSLLQFLSSLAPNLRDLTLANITLPPNKGSWDSVVLRIADCMELDRLELSNASDYRGTQLQGQQRRQGRTMFDKDARVFDKTQLRVVRARYKGLLKLKEIASSAP